MQQNKCTAKYHRRKVPCSEAVKPSLQIPMLPSLASSSRAASVLSLASIIACWQPADGLFNGQHRIDINSKDVHDGGPDFSVSSGMNMLWASPIAHVRLAHLSRWFVAVIERLPDCILRIT